MATEAELMLFTTWYSPFGQRVQVALTEKGIPFELIPVDYANKPKLLLEANPIYKKVPTIIHNGKPVAESLVILQYLEDAWPEQVPLLPKDAYDKSKIRFWNDYIYQGFSTFFGALRVKAVSPENQEANEASIKVLRTLDTAMVSFSAEGPFFTGDKFGLLDVVLAPLVPFWIILEKLGGIILPGADEIPRLHKWIEVVKVHPSVSSTLPSGEKTLEYWNSTAAKYKKRVSEAAAQAAAPK